MSDHDNPKRRTVIKVTGKVSNISVTNSTFTGFDTFWDSSEGTVEGLHLSLNRIYGSGSDLIILGDAVGVNIAGNLATAEVPKAFADELLAAARNPQQKAPLLSRLATWLKPSEVDAFADLIDRISGSSG